MQCAPPFELPTADTEPRDTREFVYELKFYVAEAHAGALLDWARRQLPPDPHGGGPHGDAYHVSSLYFDTAAHDVLARRGSFARCKYRVRRYGESEQVFLERKTRGRYRVFKRRSPTSTEALPRLLAAQPARGWSGYWFHRRLLARGLLAVGRVDYERIARIGQGSFGPLRLTLDRDLRAWCARGLSFQAQGEGVPLGAGQRILELKFGHAMPAVFKVLIREFAPRLSGISKYRLASQALGLWPPPLARAAAPETPFVAAPAAPPCEAPTALASLARAAC